MNYNRSIRTHGGYDTARTIAKLISFIGWALIVLPFLALFLGVLG